VHWHEDGKSWGSGELIQWLSNNFFKSDTLAINRQVFQLKWPESILGPILVGTLSLNCQIAHSTMGQGALLVVVQSVALQYMKLGWFTTAILTEVFSAWWQMEPLTGLLLPRWFWTRNSMLNGILVGTDLECSMTPA
jgi:hypothetical protein